MPAPTSSRNKLGLGCLVLFALPFAGFGLIAAFQAVKHFAAHDWKQGLFLALFGVVFSSVGFGLGIFASKKLKQQQALETTHPDEPWLCREDWARGEVKSTGKAGLIFIWIFALFWNAISSAVFFSILNQASRGKAIYAVSIFPAAGMLLLVWAVRQTIRWRRFGESVFKLTTVPGVIGGALAGVVHTARPLYRASEIRLRLTCLERDTSGDSTNERLQWEEEKVLTGEVLQGGGVPVVFNIPFDCQSTATLSAGRSIVWRLAVSAMVPGTDYAAQFEVPVFKTAQSRADAPKLADPAAVYEKRLDATSLRGIRIQPSAGGGTTFTFAAARNKSAGFGLLLFTAIWTGAIVFMIRLKAPIIFPIVFGLFELVLLLILSSIWTSASRVVVDASGIQLASRWMFFRKKRSLAASDVTSIRPRMSMSSGSATYYDLQAHLKGGKKISLASCVRSKRESEWLAAEMEKALGRK